MPEAGKPTRRPWSCRTSAVSYCGLPSHLLRRAGLSLFSGRGIPSHVGIFVSFAVFGG